MLEKSTTRKVYLYVQDYIRKHRYPPTLREIGEGCFLNTSAVTRHLIKLEQEGKIEREEGVARGIRLLEPDDD